MAGTARSLCDYAPGPRLGAHMSIAGGIDRAVDRARQVGATALQVFVKSARQWSAPRLRGEVAAAFREGVDSAGIGRHVMAHASYLVNLASADNGLWSRSVRALAGELDRCIDLRIPFLVVHPGAHNGAGADNAVGRVARALDHLYGAPPSKVRDRRRVAVLLEITAGQGTQLGSSFEELASILERAACREHLGVCFDTCHALAAGYEFRDARSYRETFRRFDRVIGLARLKGFHLNDSRGALGSRRDRHAHIGRGEVGLEAFRLIVNDRRFRDLPMVLETPKGDDLAEDQLNLAVLRAMVRP